MTMKKIIVMGNSVAGAVAIEEIRQKDKESEIILFSLDEIPFANRDMFAQFISGNAKKNVVGYKNDQFFTEQRVQLINDKVISRINLSRKKVHTEDKSQFDFDALILSQLPQIKFAEIKGNNKTGVYGTQRFKDISEITKNLPFIETAVVQSDDFQGLKLAAALAKKNKDVALIISNESVLPLILNTDIGKAFAHVLKDKNLHIVFDNPIVEILGDVDAKAVRLKSGKVIAADAVILGKSFNDMRIFSEAPQQQNERLKVDEAFQTSYEGVFAVDQMCSLAQETLLTPALELQGKAVAAAVLKESFTFVQPVVSESLEFENWSINLLGDSRQAFSGEIVSYKQQDNQAVVYVLKDNRAIGAALFNADSMKETVLQQIQQNASVEELAHSYQPNDGQQLQTS